MSGFPQTNTIGVHVTHKLIYEYSTFCKTSTLTLGAAPYQGDNINFDVSVGGDLLYSTSTKCVSIY